MKNAYDVMDTTALRCAFAVGICLLPFSAMAQTQPLLPLPSPVVSTVPANGDVNPYGVAFVPQLANTRNTLQPGDVLVSNFNNADNLQGTGTTIIRVDGKGQQSLFFQGKAGLGLTAALGVVRAGFVFVGNLPTTDGTSATVQPGSLLVLDANGNQVGQLANLSLVNGPWGMAIRDNGDTAQLFLSNVLSGTVVRLDLAFSDAGVVIRNAVQLAAGFTHRTDPAALVLGPSGLFYDPRADVLYMASSADNAVYAIADAGSDDDNHATTVIFKDATHLHGPLDLVMAPNGHLIVANSDGSNADPNQPSELVEFELDGDFVAQFPVDKNNGGAFGLGVETIGGGTVTRVAAVDDNQNTVTIWAISNK